MNFGQHYSAYLNLTEYIEMMPRYFNSINYIA